MTANRLLLFVAFVVVALAAVLLAFKTTWSYVDVLFPAGVATYFLSLLVAPK